MFSLAEHYPVSENQSSAVSSLHSSDHFSFYYRDILSEFHVCGNEENNQKMVRLFIQSHFDF